MVSQAEGVSASIVRSDSVDRRGSGAGANPRNCRNLEPIVYAASAVVASSSGAEPIDHAYRSPATIAYT
jgi:hypothetical protein